MLFLSTDTNSARLLARSLFRGQLTAVRGGWLSPRLKLSPLPLPVLALKYLHRGSRLMRRRRETRSIISATFIKLSTCWKFSGDSQARQLKTSQASAKMKEKRYRWNSKANRAKDYCCRPRGFLSLTARLCSLIDHEMTCVNSGFYLRSFE